MSMIILSVAAIISLYALSRLAKKDAAKKGTRPDTGESKGKST